MLSYVAYFFGGLFLMNALPHLVAGTMGKRFQSPFANPPGRGLSSPVVNVLWGNFNFIVGHALVFHWSPASLIAEVGALLISLRLASHFGKMYANEKTT
jgi:hypothetical protein